MVYELCTWLINVGYWFSLTLQLLHIVTGAIGSGKSMGGLRFSVDEFQSNANICFMYKQCSSK